MTDDRWKSGDAELTNALRAMYPMPSDEAYWDALEKRIIARIANAHDHTHTVWWSELADMARPGMAAAAAIVVAASLALMHSRQMELRSAYSSIVAPAAIETSSRGMPAGDGDAAIHALISR